MVIPFPQVYIYHDSIFFEVIWKISTYFTIYAFINNHTTKFLFRLFKSMPIVLTVALILYFWVCSVYLLSLLQYCSLLSILQYCSLLSILQYYSLLSILQYCSLLSILIWMSSNHIAAFRLVDLFYRKTYQSQLQKICKQNYFAIEHLSCAFVVNIEKSHSFVFCCLIILIDNFPELNQF